MFIYTFSFSKQPKKKDNLKDKVSLTRYISIPLSDLSFLRKIAIILCRWQIRDYLVNERWNASKLDELDFGRNFSPDSRGIRPARPSCLISPPSRCSLNVVICVEKLCDAIF